MNSGVDKPDFAISCMDDILTELEEISADLGNVCDCVSVTDKLTSSSDTGTEGFSDEVMYTILETCGEIVYVLCY